MTAKHLSTQNTETIREIQLISDKLFLEDLMVLGVLLPHWPKVYEEIFCKASFFDWVVCFFFPLKVCSHKHISNPKSQPGSSPSISPHKHSKPEHSLPYTCITLRAFQAPWQRNQFHQLNSEGIYKPQIYKPQKDTQDLHMYRVQQSLERSHWIAYLGIALKTALESHPPCYLLLLHTNFKALYSQMLTGCDF